MTNPEQAPPVQAQSAEDAALKALESLGVGFLNVLTSMAEGIKKMTELFYKGGLALGRVGTAIIEGTEQKVLDWTVIDLPPPPDEIAEDLNNSGDTYAYMHYCEGIYKLDLEKEEKPYLKAKNRLEELKAMKKSSREEMSTLSVVVDQKQEELRGAERTRDNYEPGTDGLYEQYDAEVKVIQKDLESLMKAHDKKYESLHVNNYKRDSRLFTGDLNGVPLSLDSTIAILETQVGSKEKKVNELRKKYEWSRDAKAQYVKRLDEKIEDINQKISEAIVACGGFEITCNEAQKLAIKTMRENLTKRQTERASFAAQEKDANKKIDEAKKGRRQSASNKTVSTDEKLPTTPENPPVEVIDTLKDVIV